MDFVFTFYQPYTNVNGSGEATITVSPALVGQTTFLVVPQHITSPGHERWVLTIPDINAPNGTYNFSMSRTGTGTQGFTRNVINCRSWTAGCTCSQTPDVLDLTVITPDTNGFLRNCTLTYGPMPSDQIAVGAGPYWHSEEFTHPTFSPVRYVLALRCTKPDGTSSGDVWLWYSRSYLGDVIHKWPMAVGNGNTCDPLNWTVNEPVPSNGPGRAVITG